MADSSHFTCPHCSKRYPVLPTLVGRRVRCTSCRQAFVLQADGHAEALTVPPPQTRPPDEIERLSRQWTAKATTAVSRQQAERATLGAIPRPQRLTTRKEAKRRSLAANLRDVADAAAEHVQQQEACSGRSSQQRIPTRHAAEPVLRQEGEQAGRRRRVGFTLITAVVLLAAVLVGMGTWPSPPAAAVWERYAEQREDPAVLWLEEIATGIRPLLLADPGALSWSKPIHVELAPAGPVLARLKDRIYAPGIAAWVAVGQRQMVSRLVGSTSAASYELLIDQLRAADVDLITNRELLDALYDALASEEAVRVVGAFLAGSAAGPDPQYLRERLLSGDLPERGRFVRAVGDDGLALLREGRQVRVQALSRWSGVAVACEGAGWDDRLRVLDCFPADQPEREANALLIQESRAVSVFGSLQ
ncbi:MAG: hypothetical protein ACOCXA_01630 [Planctomycetota bacterium]